MIPELGHYALILALCFAIAQVVLLVVKNPLPFGPLSPTRASAREGGRGLGRGGQKGDLIRPTAYGQCFFITLAFLALAYSFLRNDFSVAYVALNSNSQLPWIYRFCAIWGAHEGSLLLWVLLLSFWTVGVALCSRRLPPLIVARVLAVLGMISSGFLLFMLVTSNPFLRYLPNFPQDGRDLNPLLQDPGLVSHPPMLYMGYVGFSVAFAFAIAALISGRLDAAWARWAKPWTLLAWCFLTLGIILGSWWAYRELGWGGWWFWDPVENASLLPWLSGTALIHSLVVTAKRDAFKAWTALLAIFTFSLSLIGTFIVRSGVLISVHAFAVDPWRGVFILGFLVFVIGSSLLLYALRAQSLRHEVNFGWLSRESFILVNNLLLTGAMLTILLGTLYPLIIDSLGLEKLSVGPPYFNLVFIPFAAGILFFMGGATFSRWYATEFKLIRRRALMSLVVAVVLAIILPPLLAQQWHWQVILGLSLLFWVMVTTAPLMLRKLTRSQWGMVVAHLGVAVCGLGIVLSSYYSEQREVRMQPQDIAMIGPYQFQLLGTREITGPNYRGIEAGVLVRKNNHIITLLRPEQRIYNVQHAALAKTAIDAGWFRDLYVALGEPLPQNAWSLRLYYKPFVRWIWYGGLLMILGGLLAIPQRKFPSPLVGEGAEGG